MENLSGKQLGPYQVMAPLGEGGMASVYKAYQPGVERYVALKILPRHLASDPEFVGRFEQEAKVLANLQHPHILPVFDFGHADDYTYIVMPLLGNGDLNDLLHDRPLPLEQIRHIISQVGDALDYAHQHGLVHRDVKPNNVLLDERGNCLLSDFGITKIVEGTAKFTATGGIIGTPAYMSPEQGMGQKLDGRSDIYSLGIMLYEMATGRVPYRAETPIAVVFKHIQDPLPPPRQLNPALPEAVERVIFKALAKQPEQRYATAGEMVRALRAAIPETISAETISADEDKTVKSSGGSTVTPLAQPTAPATAVQKPARAKLPWILVAAGGVIVIIGVIAFLTLSKNDQINIEATLAAAMAATEQAKTNAAQPPETATAALVLSPTPLPTSTPLSSTATPVPVTATPVPATPVPTATSIPPTPTLSAQLFAADFKGTALDEQQWVTIAGDGHIEVNNGLVRLTSAGQTFPLIRPRENPFPAAGDFRLKVSLRYLSVAERGVGFRIGTTLADYGAKQDLDRNELFRGRVVEIWQDTKNWHISVGDDNTEVYILPGPDLNQHDIEINYTGNVYQVMVDGKEVYISNPNPNPNQPTVLWFGNPAQVDSAGAWSSLEITHVSITP